MSKKKNNKKTFQYIIKKWANKTINSIDVLKEFYKDIVLNFDSLLFKGQASDKWILSSSFNRFIVRQNKLLNKLAYVNVETFLSESRKMLSNIRGKNLQYIKRDDLSLLLSETINLNLTSPFIQFTSSINDALLSASKKFTYKNENNNSIETDGSILLMLRKAPEKTEFEFDKDKNNISIYNSYFDKDRLVSPKAFFILQNKENEKEMMKAYNIIKINLSIEIKSHIRKIIKNFNANKELIDPNLEEFFHSLVNDSRSINFLEGNAFYNLLIIKKEIEDAQTEYIKAIHSNLQHASYEERESIKTFRWDGFLNNFIKRSEDKYKMICIHANYWYSNALKPYNYIYSYESNKQYLSTGDLKEEIVRLGSYIYEWRKLINIFKEVIKMIKNPNYDLNYKIDKSYSKYMEFKKKKTEFYQNKKYWW